MQIIQLILFKGAWYLSNLHYYINHFEATDVYCELRTAIFIIKESGYIEIVKCG